MDDWIDVKDNLPKTVEQETSTGQRYFSKHVFVKRGKRNWKACYKPSTKQWFSRKGVEITKYVEFWKPIINN